MKWTDWGLVIAALMIAYGVVGVIWNARRRRRNSDALIEGAVLAAKGAELTLGVEADSRKLKPRCSASSTEVIRRILVDSDFHVELDFLRDFDVGMEANRPGKPEAFIRQRDRFTALAAEEVDKVRVRALDTLVRLYAAKLTDDQVATLAAEAMPVYDPTPPDPEDYLAPHPGVRFRNSLTAHFGRDLYHSRNEVIVRYAVAAVGHAEERLRKELDLPPRFAD